MIIGGRFNGPPDSGNGGYTAGRIAAVVGEPVVEVTLRRPPPLDTPLRTEPAGPTLRVLAGDDLVAEATAARLEETPVAPVASDIVETAAGAYPGFVEHPFPTCYVCGPRRPADDGLRIFPGPLPDGRTAAAWRVPADVSAVTVWAALDCPGGWAVLAPGRPYVLGRITARVDRVPAPETECVVTGEPVAVQGRKAQVRTALYQWGEHGPELLAQAQAIWIAV